MNVSALCYGGMHMTFQLKPSRFGNDLRSFMSDGIWTSPLAS